MMSDDLLDGLDTVHDGHRQIHEDNIPARVDLFTMVVPQMETLPGHPTAH